MYACTLTFCAIIEMVGCCDETWRNSCGMCEHTICLKYREKYASPDAATLSYSSRWAMWKITSSGSSGIFYPYMHHCEVTSIYWKRTSLLLLLLANASAWPKHRKEQRHVLGAREEKHKGENVLLRPQTTSRLLLLSKQREGLIVRDSYDGWWRGAVGLWLWFMAYSVKK